MVMETNQCTVSDVHVIDKACGNLDFDEEQAREDRQGNFKTSHMISVY